MSRKCHRSIRIPWKKGRCNLAAVRKMQKSCKSLATDHIHYTRVHNSISNKWLTHTLGSEKVVPICRSNRFWAGLWTDLPIEQILMRSLKSSGGLTSMAWQNYCVLWIYSMHKYAANHNVMVSQIGLHLGNMLKWVTVNVKEMFKICKRWKNGFVTIIHLTGTKSSWNCRLLI